MWLVKTCVWAFLLSVSEAELKAGDRNLNVCMQACVRVFVACGMCSTEGPNEEYPSQYSTSKTVWEEEKKISTYVLADEPREMVHQAMVGRGIWLVTQGCRVPLSRCGTSRVIGHASHSVC
jgi:hypothetical protein